MGKPEYFTSPNSIILVSRKELRKEAITYLESLRLAREIVKPSVLQHQLILITFSLQPNLIYELSAYDRFLLTRFRLGIIHRLVSFPVLNDWSSVLQTCPCDDQSSQSSIHTVLFCKLYGEIRKFWIVPILRYWGLRQCRPAFMKLQRLENVHVAWRLSMF